MADASELSGAERVAAFLLSLEPEAATEVMKHIADEVVPEVAEAMTTLDASRSGPEKIQSLYGSLASELVRRGAVRPVDTGQLSVLLESSLGRKAADGVLDQIRERRLNEKPFLAIEGQSPASIARVLSEESPAVCALVLAHLDPSLSAAVISTFSKEKSLDVVRRMAALKPPGYEILRSIAGGLEERLDRIGGGGAVQVDPSMRLKSIADMLNFAGSEVEKTVMEGLESEDGAMAGEIRDFMFTWDDLADVDKRAMQKVLGSVETKTLSIALKACSAAVEGNIMANLSSRVKDMVAEEREIAGAVPMSDVKAARNEVMQAVRALMESGEFTPAKAGEDLVT